MARLLRLIDCTKENYSSESSKGKASPKKSPLVITENLEVYRSSVNLEAAARKARTQCIVGALSSVLGFLGVIAGSPTQHPALHGMVCFGAGIISYKHLFLTKKEIATIGLHHLDNIVVLPTPPLKEGEEVVEDISVEEKLQATPELKVVLTTSTSRLFLTIADPSAGWDGAKYTGLIADDRTAFTDVLRAMYIEEVSGWGKEGVSISEDSELLTALLATDKVIAEYEVERRDDVDSSSALVPEEDPKKHFRKLLDKAQAAKHQPQSLSQKIGMPRTAEFEMSQIGRHTLISGMIFLTAGLLYIGRWANGEGKTQTGGMENSSLWDLVEQWQIRMGTLPPKQQPPTQQ
eukprot:CAMPEP_0206455758 /NCGR_PEP_ID=MMETSP0324_2-20121206/21963_1 /ASSEMBLY_ACC=CAM_ASM_000836 /TAXON_ID=2866 /ORGANISM="Crypthecodinium cohnii, Strain Seligo" /LENGTH=347 /DNA_ID=CAMNT_0053926563 /DNA_START=65 /DNA_END=1109 /DNA_ORIENTATION=+